MMVRDFQCVIGRECIVQMPEAAGRQPDYVLACVGGGSNAMGIFYPYLAHAGVRLVGVEAAGEGIATGNATMETEPPSKPSTGNVIASSCCRVPMTYRSGK